MKSALSEVLGDLGQSPDQRILRLYRRWSEGGFGLLLTGNVMIDRAQLGEPGNIVIDDERDLATLTRWAETAHAGGSPIWMQLCHPGRQANPVVNRQAPVAPSAIAADIPGFRVPTALTERDIHDIIDRFATTARIAEKAGFDGVQIHAAHGYLVSQFLSPLANHRDDDWGGDPARRARFLLEIVRRVRATVGPQFAVSVKLNSADFQRGGFTEDESSDVVARLAIERIDLLEISGGSFESLAMMGRPTDRLGSAQQREAYFLEYAHTVRANAGATPSRSPADFGRVRPWWRLWKRATATSSASGDRCACSRTPAGHYSPGTSSCPAPGCHGYARARSRARAPFGRSPERWIYSGIPISCTAWRRAPSLRPSALGGERHTR